MTHHLRVAGIRFAVDCSDPGSWPVIAQGFGPFEVAEASADVYLRVEIDPARTSFSGERALPQFAAGGFSGEDYEVRSEGDALVIRQPEAAFPLSAVIKVVLARMLLERGAVMVHGVCVAAEGRAALFSGASGAGKSTLGSWARAGGLGLLADELVVLRRRDDETIHVEGTPWNVGAPLDASLAALGILAHAPEHRVEDVPPTEVLRVLTTNILLADESPQTRHRAFEIARAALASARTVRLLFARDPGVADALRTIL